MVSKLLVFCLIFSENDAMRNSTWLGCKRKAGFELCGINGGKKYWIQYQQKMLIIHSITWNYECEPFHHLMHFNALSIKNSMHLVFFFGWKVHNNKMVEEFSMDERKKN